MIIGYGTSHDAGVALVDTETGEPLFAASLERFTRVKNDARSPVSVLDWAEREVPGFAANYHLLSLDGERFFREEAGFYQLETSGGAAPFSYRWTGAEAVITLPEPWGCHSIELTLPTKTTARRKFEASVLLNGKPAGVVSNSKARWVLKSHGHCPLTEVRLRCSTPFCVQPDPRQLGIMLTGVRVFSSQTPEAADQEPTYSSIARLVRKQFVDLRRLGLRPLTTYELLRYLNYFRAATLAGKRSIADYFLQPMKLDSTYDHHLCHAASAYYPSGFDEALVFTLDGMGDWYSARVMTARAGRLTPVAEYYYEQMSTGLDYEIITAMLGFNPARHAGKITGLAAFGKENPVCEAALDKFFANVWGRGGQRGCSYESFMRSRDNVGHRRLHEIRQSEFGEFTREDIAYAIQKRTENQVRDFVTKYKAQWPGIENVCLSGGVFANVRVNQEVHRLGFKKIFVQPAMSDAGLCYGAALLECVKRRGGMLKPYKLRDVFLGPSFTREFIESEMRRHELTGDYIEESAIGEAIAREIEARRVVAHFYGRMEFGPRALGNRSILYSAADPDVNRWLNEQLNRTEFMPFAPAVMSDYAEEYFLDIEGAEHPAEFMTITFNCTEKARREIPAAVHVDGTARPQIVYEERNPRFYSILKAYHELTGSAVVINTSFNMHEEPIVCTPQDAIRSFQQGKLDVLILGNYLVRRAKS